MFTTFRESIQWGGRTLTLETGKVARQADAAVMVTYGETTVLCTVVAAKHAAPGASFFPLTVVYQEKSYAAGRIPGGFFKREGRPSEHETLTSRLIDRPIRPLFPEQFRNEVQVICTVLTYDLENEADIPALIGASAALTLSGVPFFGPVGAARVGFKDGAYVLNPSYTEAEEGDLDLVVAGTVDGVLMVESEAKELSEKTMLDAVTFGHNSFQSVIEMVIRLAEKAAKEPWDLPEASNEDTLLANKVIQLARPGLEAAYKIAEKQARYAKVSETLHEVFQSFGELSEIEKSVIENAFKTLQQEIVRGKIVKDKTRIDGRTPTEIRPISAEVGFLPRLHGSALFSRGETQALVIATLGTGDDEQLIDALGGEYKERFLLHYNFPPYSVGETGRMGSPGRREIGHGKLAWRALHPLMPTKEQFGYTVRVVSEITACNGSSSMATVCGSSLALMDAGVPLPRPVAGIAMGLIKEGKEFVVLSDILGDEDALGDMDFKVAGTEKGITALQMDLKITSIDADIMQTALKQAHEGRLHILGAMSKSLGAARQDVNANAPRIETIQIPKAKIRELIGPGGKVIREICEVTGAKIDIEDDGTVHVAGLSQEVLDAAMARIQDVVAVPEIGRVYDAIVVKIADFGAFVSIMNGKQQGLVHISELAAERVKTVTDVVKEGDHVKAKVIDIDDKGRVKMSMKAALADN